MNFQNDSHPISSRNSATVFYIDREFAIVDGLKNREPDALAGLFDMYASYIQKILARVLGSRHFELDDCLQETFMTAFYKAGQLKDASYLKTWLTRIAIHRALDQLRKRKRESWLQFRSPESLPAVPVSAHRLEDAEALSAVYTVLDAIPHRERVMFTLRRLEKMTVPEISAACGVSQATVKRRIASAQKRFEKLVMATPALEGWLSEHGVWRER